MLVVMLILFVDLPRVEMLPSRQFLPRGLHGKLDCPVDANPPPYSIEWLKNEKPLEESMFGGRLAMDRQGSLVFKTVETGDEGRYTCLATSNIGKGSPSSVIHVVVSGECDVIIILIVFFSFIQTLW